VGYLNASEAVGDVGLASLAIMGACDYSVLMVRRLWGLSRGKATCCDSHGRCVMWKANMER
jgi:hypothetical protein